MRFQAKWKPVRVKKTRICSAAELPCAPSSLEQRGARHEGIERRPELRAVAVLFLQDLVLGAGDDEMRAGAQMIGEFLDRRSGNNAVVGGGQHEEGRGIFGGEMG